MLTKWWYSLAVGLGTLCAPVVGSRPCHATVHLTVGTPEQGGQYATVQAAVDAVPGSSGQPNDRRHVIDIMPGTYVERVQIPTFKPLVTLRGQDPLTTILTFNETTSTPPNESTGHASTVVQGTDFIAENLTFQNSFGPGTQALAIYAKADRLIFNNVRFLGWQDTLRSESGRHYFVDSYVEGSVDFIYGKGTAFFDRTTIYPKSSGYVTAQGRESAEETNGYVFKDSTITGSAAAGSVYLGRPWQTHSRAVFIDTKMGPAVSPLGWSAWSGNNNHLTAYFAEYNSMDLDGDPLDVSQRVSWSHQLSAAEAEAFSMQNWLSGWVPVLDPESVAVMGDYNGNHVIDAADYTVWRDAVANGWTTLTNDPTPGVVDESDFTYWRNHFGQSPGAGSGQSTANVPEPSGRLLWSLGGWATVGWVWRCRGVSRRRDLA